MKEKIRNQKVKIVIKGYASPPGTSEYNESLAHKRAQHIAQLLTPKIGTDEKGNAICIFNCIGIGEDTDDPRRYAKITIVKL